MESITIINPSIQYGVLPPSQLNAHPGKIVSIQGFPLSSSGLGTVLESLGSIAPHFLGYASRPLRNPPPPGTVWPPPNLTQPFPT